MAENEIFISFAPKGDEDVLSAIKKVTRHVGDLKRIAKTPIDLEIVKGSMAPADFERLKTTIEKAKEATAGLGREAAKTGREAAAAARQAEKFAMSMAKMGSGSKFTDNSGLTAGAFAAGAGGIPAGAKGVKDLGDKAGQAQAKVQSLGASLGFVGRILAAMAIRRVASEIFHMADAFTAFQNKLKATVKEDSVGFIGDELFRIAQDSRTSLESITTAFSRTTRSVKALGKSQQEVLQFTSTLSKAIQIGGSNAVEASNAMIQLSQGMGSGALRGDELRSVLEQLPIVAELIADKMGVPIAALRTLGAAGKLTTEVIFDAINSRTAEIDAKMKNMSLTVGQAWTRLVNAMTMKSQELGGVMKTLADTIQFITDNLDTFATIFISLSAALAAGFAVKGVMALVGAFNALTVALAAGTGGLSIVLSTLTVVTAALIPFIAQIKLSEEGTATFGDVWSATWEEVKDTFKSDDLKNGIKDTETAMNGLSDATQTWMKWTAGAFDMLTNSMPIISQMKAALATATGANNMTMFSDKTQKIIDRVNMSAEFDETMREIKNAQNILGEDYAQHRPDGSDGIMTYDELIDSWDNPKYTPPEKKTKNPSGMTMSELMSQLGKERDKVSAMDDQSDPSIEGRVMRGWLDAVDKLEDKIANNLTPAQSKLIEETIKEKVILQDMLKLRESIQKSMEEEQKLQVQQLIDGIKEQIEREKANKELVKEFQEARADRQIEKKNNFNTVADTLDPNMAINRDIQTMMEFQRMAKAQGLPEWAELATKRIEELKQSMRWKNSHFQTFADQMNSIFGPNGTLVKGFSDAAAKAFIMSQGLNDLKRAMIDLLNNVQQQALSALIQLPLNMAMGSLQNAFAGAALPSASGATSPTTAIPGAGGIMRQDPYRKFADGGYTGNYGINEPAGIVHGQEYVLNADATRRMGRQTLDAINKGASMGGSKAPTTNITVNNTAGVQVETREIGPGEVEIMISRAIREKTGKVIAGHLNDPNSIVSRSLSKNTTSERRR